MARYSPENWNANKVALMENALTALPNQVCTAQAFVPWLSIADITHP